MTTLFYILAYLAVIGFVATAAIKVKGYLAASPLHARWELYPVPHEGPKGSYGGSFMEETDWWTKPRHVDHLGDIKALLEEVLFLHATFTHNLKLWFRTYPPAATLRGSWRCRSGKAHPPGRACLPAAPSAPLF